MMYRNSMKMKYVKPVQSIVDKIINNTHGVEVVPTFSDGPRSTLSCIVHKLGTEMYGLVSVNVDGYNDDVNCFEFNGKLYDYCKAEGFSQNQMISDESFENKVLTLLSVDEFVNKFTKGD